MSRRITIKTTMDRPDILKKSLDELECQYDHTKNKFTVSSFEGTNFLYRGCGVDVDAGKIFYDEDDSRARSFVQGTLRQTYSKTSVLEKKLEMGDQILQEFVAQDDTYIEDSYGGFETGDYLIISEGDPHVEA